MEDSLQTVDIRAKKRVLAEFVKDMAELESEELKARKTAEKCFEEAEEIRKARELTALKNELEKKRNFLKNRKKEKPPVVSTMLGFIIGAGVVGVIAGGIGATIGGAIVVSLLENLWLSVDQNTVAAITGILIGGFVAIAGVCIGIATCFDEKKEYKNKLKEYPKLILEEEAKIAELERKTQDQAVFIQKHGEEYVKYADKLSEEKGKLYALNVVPPDYRYMKCVVILDYVFRNDLADDMRGAILYYEDRCYKQVVEEGFDRIVDAIEDLTAEMRHLHRSLEYIEEQAKEIYGEISRAADGIAINNTLQAATLAENYSAHQKMEYYAEQYRQGLL